MHQTPETFIFYVDDDPDDRALFEHILNALGYKSVLFDCGEKLFATLQAGILKPSVIVTDLNMPRQDGFDILCQLRADRNFDAVPIVILSTSSNTLVVKQCFDAGATLYMVKPCSYNIMLDSLRAMLQTDWPNFQRDKASFFIPAGD